MKWLALVVVLASCGAPMKPCDASTCAGCCAADGQCVGGNDSQACGLGGQLCVRCSAEPMCVAGRCTSGAGGSGGEGGSGGGMAPVDAGTRVGCAGTQYSEALPTTASVADLNFTSSMAQAYLVSALERRFPHGKALVEGGLANPVSAQQSNCVTTFLGDTSSGPAVLRQASTIVHECGHFFDLGLARTTANQAVYVIAPGLQRTCGNGDTTARGGRTFARSLIKTDSYYAMRRACMNMSSATCDMYADIYLDGSATNATFESGDQGFNSLLEEANQYVNSLASALAFRDLYQGRRVSERDGILTFLWYLERYLAMAKANDPQAYATITGDACWREAILSVWDRAWFYLQASVAYASTLGINDAAILTLVETPSLRAEIDALRTLQCN